ncbi:permease [Geobacter hydrogenophilus]|uniref:Permease n=1 Tax=Geobacter hydrogenophilus TaxID=40983 RepID=A0A9W6LC88_9BACT|nr:permease [Geobacter hydrogenophilus]MBT0894124.1 permease [Geobacter hydrogenophilus]GLI38593.1 permease [Geobacter hydrogenophilus]
MALKLFGSKPKEACEVHGHHAGSGNRMLIAMILISLSLVVWHVWVTGTGGRPALSDGAPVSFPVLLGSELWDLFFSEHGVMAELRDVLPYFLVGILIAGYLRTYKIAVKLQASLRKYGVLSVFLASFVGIITPLCACGTVTTAISLLVAGIPLAPVMALMVTSPLLSPSTYLLTLNDLGPEWTAIRTISAFSMGIFAGLVTHFLSKRPGFRKNEIFIEGALVRGDFHDEDYPDERLRCNCRRKFGNRVAVRTGNTFLIFLAKSVEMLWVVGKYVIVGVIIGAVVERYMPQEWVYRFFGRKDPLDILWVTLASVPMFLHQISASSIIHHIKGSLGGTLDAGAALAFMIGGPVTAVPTMVLFWSFFRKRVFFLYMFVCLSGTLLIAYTFQALLFTPGVDIGNPLLKGVASLSGGEAAAIVKHDTNVRMVMDPAGKGIVATYSNAVEGWGGVVFDGGKGRFTAAMDNRHDNRTYIGNIADWLAENSFAASSTRILVYSLGSGAGDDASLLGEKALAELGSKGYTVRRAGRRDVPHLTEGLLAGYGQVWLFFADAAAGLNDAEVKLLVDFNAKGGGALIVPSRPQPGDASLRGANALASRFGVTFAGVADNGPEVRVSAASAVLNRSAEWLGSVLKLVKKA